MSGVEFRVWGCRGTIACPGASRVRYGGETTCFEIVSRTGDRLVIDCGTGMRALGRALMADRTRRVNVLLSHFHADHLLGLAVFGPLIHHSAFITLWRDEDPEATRQAIDRLFSPPIWPIRVARMPSLRFARLENSSNKIESFDVRPFALNHVGGCTGFAIDVDGRRIIIAADHEHGDPVCDANLLEIARGADLLVYDGAYSDEEYEQRRGWGHSTRNEGARLGLHAGVRRVLLTHHEPSAEDDALDAAGVELEASYPFVLLAREGMVVEL